VVAVLVLVVVKIYGSVRREWHKYVIENAIGMGHSTMGLSRAMARRTAIKRFASQPQLPQGHSVVFPIPQAGAVAVSIPQGGEPALPISRGGGSAWASAPASMDELEPEAAIEAAAAAMVADGSNQAAASPQKRLPLGPPAVSEEPLPPPTTLESSLGPSAVLETPLGLPAVSTAPIPPAAISETSLARGGTWSPGDKYNQTAAAPAAAVAAVTIGATAKTAKDTSRASRESGMHTLAPLDRSAAAGVTVAETEAESARAAAKGKEGTEAAARAAAKGAAATGAAANVVAVSAAAGVAVGGPLSPGAAEQYRGGALPAEQYRGGAPGGTRTEVATRDSIEQVHIYIAIYK